jgi:hypothetical protein
MNAVKPAKPQEMQVALAVEGDIRELLREEITPPRKTPPRPVVVANGSEIGAADINAMVFRAAQGSVKELDSLIATLQHVREQLTSEGERIQRSIAKFVQSSQSTMESVKVIAESVNAWKPGAPAQIDRTQPNS